MSIITPIRLQSQISIERVAKKESSDQNSSLRQQERKEPSHDRRICRYQYNHKSGKCGI